MTRSAALLTLILLAVLAFESRPASVEAASDLGDPATSPARLEVLDGRVSVLSRGQPPRSVRAGRSEAVFGDGYVEVPVAARARVSWPGQGSVLLEGPSALHWRPGGDPAGPRSARVVQVELFEVHRAELEVRGGSLELALPDDWHTTLRGGAVQLRGRASGPIELWNHAGPDVVLRWLGDPAQARPPVAVRPGAGVHLARPRHTRREDRLAAGTPPAWEAERATWPWRMPSAGLESPATRRELERLTDRLPGPDVATPGAPRYVLVERPDGSRVRLPLTGRTPREPSMARATATPRAQVDLRPVPVEVSVVPEARAVNPPLPGAAPDRAAEPAAPRAPVEGPPESAAMPVPSELSELSELSEPAAAAAGSARVAETARADEVAPVDGTAVVADPAPPGPAAPVEVGAPSVDPAPTFDAERSEGARPATLEPRAGDRAARAATDGPRAGAQPAPVTPNDRMDAPEAVEPAAPASSLAGPLPGGPGPHAVGPPAPAAGIQGAGSPDATAPGQPATIAPALDPPAIPAADAGTSREPAPEDEAVAEPPAPEETAARAAFDPAQWRGLERTALAGTGAVAAECPAGVELRAQPGGRVRVLATALARGPVWVFGRDAEYLLYPGATLVFEAEGGLRLSLGQVDVHAVSAGRPGWSELEPPAGSRRR